MGKFFQISIFNILTGQKRDMTELKLVWTVNMTGHRSKTIFCPERHYRGLYLELSLKQKSWSSFVWFVSLFCWYKLSTEKMCYRRFPRYPFNRLVKWSQVKLIAAEAYPGFCSTKRLAVFLLPQDGMLAHRRSLLLNFVRFPQQFAGTHLYTWVKRGTVRVKCLAQEHNTMFPARARTRNTRSRVERTNHEATAPPNLTDL